MLIVTTETIGDKKLEALGYVKGAIVQSKHIGSDFLAGLKTIIGGEITGYTDMLMQARSIATERMIAEAKALNADAIVGLRFASASLMQGAAEIVAYGTAVKIIG